MGPMGAPSGLWERVGPTGPTRGPDVDHGDQTIKLSRGLPRKHPDISFHFGVLGLRKNSCFGWSFSIQFCFCFEISHFLSKAQQSCEPAIALGSLPFGFKWSGDKKHCFWWSGNRKQKICFFVLGTESIFLSRGTENIDFWWSGERKYEFLMVNIDFLSSGDRRY